MDKSFILQLVSDRLLEFEFPDLPDSLRLRFFNALRDRVEQVAPWQVFLTGHTFSFLSPIPILNETEVERVSQFVTQALIQAHTLTASQFDSHLFEVHFGDEYGPDLKRVAQHNQLSTSQWVDRFLQGEYVVGFNGFLPGFSYLNGLQEELQAPRLDSPRSHVKAGSLAVAGHYCAIYPSDSPGGWNVVGWVNRQVFSIRHDPPCLMMPGDTVRFEVA